MCVDVHRQKLFDERRTKINELFARLHCSANKDSQFVHMICIKKGLQLVGRFLPLLDQVQNKQQQNACGQESVCVCMRTCMFYGDSIIMEIVPMG